MKRTVFEEGDEGVRLIVKRRGKAVHAPPAAPARQPIHVLYGGADRFTAETTAKLGKIALTTLDTYCRNFAEFADAMQLPGSGSLPTLGGAATKLARSIRNEPERAKAEDPAAWHAFTVFQKVRAKLKSEPIEDFRIDFEDGYGFRPDEEEDADAERTARELAVSFLKKKATNGCGFRVKSFAPATHLRAVKTLDIFLSAFTAETNGRIPPGFVVTLPKVADRSEVKEICSRLKKFEKKHNIAPGSIGLELLIETPEAVIDKKGSVAIRGIVEAAKGRCTSVHFGAYDFTSSLGIAAADQDIAHPACDMARQLTLISLAPLGVRLSDSVTTEMPIPPHRGEPLDPMMESENRRAVFGAWRRHFRNVRRSMSQGFFQSWDLHPNQLPARYAAVYHFYLESFDGNARRLRRFAEMSSKATLTGNAFDDAASVRGLLNFFSRGISCGAFSEAEAEAATGVSAEAIRSLDVSALGGASGD